VGRGTYVKRLGSCVTTNLGYASGFIGLCLHAVTCSNFTSHSPRNKQNSYSNRPKFSSSQAAFWFLMPVLVWVVRPITYGFVTAKGRVQLLSNLSFFT